MNINETNSDVYSLGTMNFSETNSDVYPLGTWDYVVFSIFLVVTAATGLYHGFAKGGQQTTQSFLLADRGVFSLPVAMTLLASFISPITLLGIPAEIYHYGGLYIDFLFSQFLLYPSIVLIFIPVFYGLKLTSAYEYLDQRFDMIIRIIGASIFIFQTAFYIAIVTYSPALAIEAVTNFALWKTILITGVVCTFYTSLGGMKAVIWTDVIMFCVMFSTTLMVIIMGTIEAGGFAHVWEFNHDEGRLDIFYFPKDLTERMSFPSLVIGGWLNSLPLWAVGQTAVQRVLSARSMTDAKVSMWLNLPFSVLITFLAAFEGLVMYAFYNGGSIPNVPVVNSTVEPVTEFILDEGRSPPNLTANDQILIYFISQQFGNIPGYQGLFIACLFAGTLSTVSSGINSLTAVTLVDIIRPYRRWRAQRSAQDTVPESESQDIILTKCLTLFFGVIAIGLAFLASKMGTLVSMANSIFGALGGPLVGAFLLGMFWKRANARGTLVGMLAGSTLGLWISIGAIVNQGNLDEALGLYKLSFMWYATFTILATVVVAIPCSEIYRLIHPEEQDKVIDPLLLVTFLRPAEIKKDQNGISMTHFQQLDEESANRNKSYQGATDSSVSNEAMSIDEDEGCTLRPAFNNKIGD